jgi:hypothetical protein
VGFKTLEKVEDEKLGKVNWSKINFSRGKKVEIFDYMLLKNDLVIQLAPSKISFCCSMFNIVDIPDSDVKIVEMFAKVTLSK